ncbi:hypothetical protein F511_11368 [Dorcoceras hygrometricum]|uniref:Uncharacterized protein n=1 Tax=Dorcoceras hygrometricum TaxID=472368 RepID=A0A2Z7A506_9LAMI|nr:hypothetical protein F511_11368 [Dorcoceras hygrometricum]
MSNTNLDFDFEALRDLHDSVNDLLHSPATKLEIINRGNEKWAYEISEASLKMADSCAAAKDLLLMSKDHLQRLKSAFRRVSAASEADSAGNQFAPHRLPRKQLKKAILKRIQSIKGVKNEYLATATDDPNLVLVANLLSEVLVTILSIVKSLSSLISMPYPQEGRSKPMEMFKLKLTRMDSLLAWGKYDAAAALKRLEAVEVVVEDLEGELEQMFRRLIRTRASLLNIITS